MLSVFPQLFFLEQVAPVLLRLVIGLIFIFHGYHKIFKNFDGAINYFQSEGIENPKIWVWVSGLIELIAGILVFVGLVTQIAVLFLVADRLAAIWRIKMKKGFHAYELDLALIVMALSLLVLGPGFFSIDLPY